jgi:lysophospholipase L1-like esterase
MQEPRRRRWLQLHLLSLAVACGSAAPTRLDPAAPTSVDESRPAAAQDDAAADGDETTSAARPASAKVEVPSELPKGTRVLQIGDSFADALGIELGKLLKQSGLRTSLETKTPSYIGEWAFGPALPKALSVYNPDLVLVTLGANEVEVPTPEQRIGAVQRLVKVVGDRPCVWILPPLWKRDTGVMQVIKDNAKPCQVLDSSQLVPELPRARDHIHPSTEGRLIWANAVLDWLKQARDPAGPRPWSLRGGPS